ncbi:hypothetical protein GCM10011325_35220 [Dyadobacter sediminis]|nr:hypothetical protein GCM10011325_35220 [Dyadobacter sediminis]
MQTPYIIGFQQAVCYWLNKAITNFSIVYNLDNKYFYTLHSHCSIVSKSDAAGQDECCNFDFRYSFITMADEEEKYLN